MQQAMSHMTPPGIADIPLTPPGSLFPFFVSRFPINRIPVSRMARRKSFHFFYAFFVWNHWNHESLEENNVLDVFPKTMAKPAILYGKRAGILLPAP